MLGLRLIILGIKQGQLSGLLLMQSLLFLLIASVIHKGELRDVCFYLYG